MTTSLLPLLLASLAPARACMEMASFRKLFRDEAPRSAEAPPEAIAITGPRTGECLAIVERAEGRYRVRRGDGPPFWIPARWVYVFQPGDDYGGFLSGGPLSYADPAPARLVLESRGFAERASKHRERRVKVLGLRRLLALSDGAEAVGPWLALHAQPESEVHLAANELLEGKEIPPDPRVITRLERAVREGPGEGVGFAVGLLVRLAGDRRARRILRRLILDPAASAEGRDAAAGFASSAWGEGASGWYRELFERRPVEEWAVARIRCSYQGPFERAAARYGDEAAFEAVVGCAREIGSLDLRFDAHRERAARWLADWAPERLAGLTPERGARLLEAAALVRSALARQPQGPLVPIRMATGEEAAGDPASAFRPAR